MNTNKNLTPPFLACLLLCMLLASCWHPPFDPAISMSEYTADKLGNPVWSAVTIMNDSDALSGYYIPNRDPTENYRGSWIREVEGITVIGLVMINPGGKSFFQESVRYVVPNTLGYSAVLLPATGGFNTNNRFFVSVANVGFAQLESGANASYWIPASVDPLIGFGSSPNTASPGVDYLFLATQKSDGTLDVFHSSHSISSFPNSTGPVSFIFAPPLKPVTPGFFAGLTDTTGFYLSARMTDGNTHTYYWADKTASPVSLPIPHQLTGILSDGRLLANTGDRLFVYSGNGSDSFRISTGSLHFVVERYIGTVWYSVFTRAIRIPPTKDNDSENEYLVEVYQIPTAELRSLAD